MTHSDEEIQRRLRLGEDSAWEFKQVEFSGERPTSPRRDDWADEIAAFANASGGVLLCGVTDDGAVQGLSRQQIVSSCPVALGLGTTPSRTARKKRRRHVRTASQHNP